MFFKHNYLHYENRSLQSNFSLYTSLLWNKLEHTIYKFRGHFYR